MLDNLWTKKGTFRGYEATAPLKLHRVGCHQERLEAFRGYEATAPLKRDWVAAPGLVRGGPSVATKPRPH